jgi:hypothetical protein
MKPIILTEEQAKNVCFAVDMTARQFGNQMESNARDREKVNKDAANIIDIIQAAMGADEQEIEVE